MGRHRRKIVDLFAGPGGWEEGLRLRGHAALGIDQDQDACATAEAAGHRRLLADVAALEPQGFAPVWGLIASPPCQAYSTAGKGLGRLDRETVISCAREIARGRDTRAMRLRSCHDERSLLTVEPLRWALALRPRWLALEQVPSVLELWSVFAALLAQEGYRTAVGLLSAERFGVPQVRKRAFLIASLDGEVVLPAPSHRSFDARRRDVPEGEHELPSWLSMAAALGCGERGVLRTHPGNFKRPPGSKCRSLERPCFTLLSNSYRWTIESRGSARGCARSTSHSGSRCPGAASRERPRADRAGAARSLPAWTHRRPSTTLLGDPRITAPGSWPRCGRRPQIVRGRPVRVSVEQASILQGFRHDYPWHGSRTSRFAQIGNAVCPPVAARVLAEAMAPTLRKEADRG